MKKTLKKLLVLIAVTAVGTLLVLPRAGHAHCQIPCGIYADGARVEAMLEDAATVEKSAKLIAELAGKSDAQSQKPAGPLGDEQGKSRAKNHRHHQ